MACSTAEVLNARVAVEGFRAQDDESAALSEALHVRHTAHLEVLALTHRDAAHVARPTPRFPNAAVP